MTLNRSSTCRQPSVPGLATRRPALRARRSGRAGDTREKVEASDRATASPSSGDSAPGRLPDLRTPTPGSSVGGWRSPGRVPQPGSSGTGPYFYAAYTRFVTGIPVSLKCLKSNSAKTLNRYMDILCHTFIIFLLPPFFNNIRSRLTKMPKVYLYDLGIKNALVGNFSDVNFRSDNGAIFENFILLEILSYFEFKDLYFYRNTSQSEIDFIVDKKFAIEVKYKNYKEKRVFRVFDIFKNYNNYIVNLSFNYDAKNYKFIDWWQFLNSIKKLKQ